MINLRNTFSGANFDHTGENCTASGEYRVENGNIQNVNVNGQYTKEDRTYNFWANRDSDGNVNVSGVPASVISDVAEEVATIMSEVGGIINNSASEE